MALPKRNREELSHTDCSKTKSVKKLDVITTWRNLELKLDNQLDFTIELTEAIPLSVRGEVKPYMLHSEFNKKKESR